MVKLDGNNSEECGHHQAQWQQSLNFRRLFTSLLLRPNLGLAAVGGQSLHMVVNILNPTRPSTTAPSAYAATKRAVQRIVHPVSASTAKFTLVLRAHCPQAIHYPIGSGPFLAVLRGFDEHA